MLNPKLSMICYDVDRKILSLRNIFVSLHFLPQSGGTVVLEEVLSLLFQIYFVVTEVIFFLNRLFLKLCLGQIIIPII